MWQFYIDKDSCRVWFELECHLCTKHEFNDFKGNKSWIQLISPIPMWNWTAIIPILQANVWYHSLNMRKIIVFHAIALPMPTSKYKAPYFKREPLFMTLNWFFFQSPFDFNLPDETVALLTNIPPPGEVFVVDMEADGFHRAVRNNGVCIFQYLFTIRWEFSPEDFCHFYYRKSILCFSSIVAKSRTLMTRYRSKCIRCLKEQKMHQPEPSRVLLNR